MRITNSMITDNFLYNMNNNMGIMDKFNSQLATNRKIVRVSDSPVGVLSSMKARQRYLTLQQYNTNLQTAKSWNTVAESSLTELNNILIDIRENITQAAGVTQPEDKKAIAVYMEELFTHMVQTCNTSIGDKYVFGGFNTTGAPFKQDNRNVEYNGILMGSVGLLGGSVMKENTTVLDPGMGDYVGFTAKGNIGYDDFEMTIGAAPNTKVTSGLDFLGDAFKWTDNSVAPPVVRDTFKYKDEITVKFEPYPAGGNDLAMVAVGEDQSGAKTKIPLALGTRGADVQNPDGTFTTKYTFSQINTGAMSGTYPALGRLDNPPVLPKMNGKTMSFTSDTPVSATDIKDNVNMTETNSIVSLKEREQAQILKAEVGFEVEMELTFTGLDVAGIGADNIFVMMRDLIGTLESGSSTPDSLGKFITQVQEQQVRILDMIVETGTRANKIKMLESRYSQDEITYTAMMDEVEAIDQAETITKFKLSETLYKQALSVGAKIIMPSLADFI